MSETELSEGEAARLRDLLHRAADGLEVTTPDPADVGLRRPQGRRGAALRRAGGWLAAAAVVVVAGVGAAWWMGAPEDRIDTVPAEPPVTVAPEVLEETGIWRLPKYLEGYRVVSAMPSSSVRPLLIAVDDVERPTRWLAVSDYGVEMPLDEHARYVELDDDLELVLRPVDEWGGVTRFGMRIGDSSAYLAGTFRGVDEEEVVELLVSSVVDARTLTDPDLRRDVLRHLRPPDGLAATWDSAAPLVEPRGSLVVTLAGDDGTDVAVTLEATELPPAVAALRLRLVSLDVSSIFEGVEGSITQAIEPREDLGRHVLEWRTLRDGRTAGAGGDGIVVITDDGTVVTATRVARADELLTADPLAEAGQMRILNSLRAMSAEQFREAVEAAGADFMDPEAVGDPAGVPTTVEASSSGASTTTEP